MTDDEDPLRFKEATRLVLVGRHPARDFGFVNPPVYHGSTVLSRNVAELLGHTGRYAYGRRGTPTSEALEEGVSLLEGGAGTVLCPSGLSACSVALLSCLSAGDHVLVPDSVYRPVRTFCDGVLKRAGVTTTYYDPMLGAGITEHVRSETRALYLEAPGSQSFEVQDVPALVAVARERGLVTLMDNTWATPLLFAPHAFGIDLSIMAGTKYLGGHSDLMLGTVSALPGAWPALKRTHGDMGLCVGPDDIALGLRGLRTLGLRLRQHEASALAVARWLAGRPEVGTVLHPAFEDCPGHAHWKRDFKGSSGLFSVVLRPVPDERVAAFLDSLALFGLGFSWGGFESLAIPFDCRAYRTATRWSPRGPAVRFHIGLEAVEDLIADLEQGIAKLTG